MENNHTISNGSITLRSFQDRVWHWVETCFGSEIAKNTLERNHRFLEESLELVQACGCTATEAHQLVDYVFTRPIGEQHQELGGVMVTLAALCAANDLNMQEHGEEELSRMRQDLGADSLDDIELIIAFEETFKIYIEDDERKQLRTVGDVVALILSRRTA